MVVLSIVIASLYIVFSIHNNRKAKIHLFEDGATILAKGVQRFVLWNDRVAVNRSLANEVEGNELIEYAFIATGRLPYESTFANGVPETLLARPVSMELRSSVWKFKDTSGAVYYDIAAQKVESDFILHLGLRRDQVDREM